MTANLSPNWLNLMRRLQGTAKLSNGAGIISVHIVVDQNGIPICWSDPKLVKMHPMNRTGEILEILSGANV